MTGARDDDTDLRPAPSAWASAAADTWSATLLAVRAELATHAALTPVEQGILDRPTSRLVSGDGRQEVVDLLAGDADLADRVLGRLDPDQREPLVRVSAPAPPAGDPTVERDTPADPNLRSLRARGRRLREERDDWRRRAEGAQAQLDRVQRDLRNVQQQLADRDARVAELERSVAEADEAHRRAVDRERRRRDGEVARLEEQLAEHRRAEEDRRTAARRRAESQERATPRPTATAESSPPQRLVPGRPTPLPRGVAPGTTEAARLLLGPGRLVLVDGYNVTRTHRDDLDLEGQRSWLIQRCVTAAASLRLRPVVVFDGQRAAATRPTVARQQVEVRFTPEGITADDELVLAVEATDDPVVVVTDDRELRDRVRAGGADLVGTTAFLGVVGR